ncbi:LysR family transcriptional regulator [Psychrosphaera aquimarina]|uniref:LysR family transcriptional regulator n=1 Tax=Psychrosphaera aquimarina TaxID=2044854 RepID=A0ABU3R1C4_9GAMM|nr:LysR family transcriptional regulator [Psychrosphaera aquimarina]MDU0113225.1 LysR family transcriptional regulator [Psychrosphaera aquimarina]
MNFSLEQLEAFTAAVENGSFSGAARKLGKAQSSISGLITNMEIDAGFDLFDRSSRSPSLTQEGKILLREIKAVLKSHDHLVKKVDSLIRQVDNEIKIAFDELSFPRGILLKILTDFESKFPTTSLLLMNCSHNEAYQLVQNGKADLAITLAVQDYPEGVLFKGFAHVQYSTVVGIDHELANIPAVGPEELAQFRHIRITDSESGFRTYDSDLSTNIWFTDTSSMMVDLVSQGFGWAELPIHLFEHRADIKRLTTRHQAVSFTQNVDMVWSHDASLGIAGEWLVDEFSRIGKTLI